MQKIAQWAAVWAAVQFSGLAGCESASQDEEAPEICVALPEQFKQDAVLPKGCYLAHKSPNLTAGIKLTLAPGVKIVFDADTGLLISGSTALVALGTAELPIVLTGAQKTRGYWKGLQFDHASRAENALAYVTVEFGGMLKYDQNTAAIKVSSDSSKCYLSMRYTTARGSPGYGLYLTGSTEVAVFEHNTFVQNAKGPVSIDSDIAGLLDAASSYTGNDVDEIAVRSNNLSKRPSWAALDVPYHLSSQLDVKVPWTVAPGTRIIGSADTDIIVSGDAAAIIAIGTAEKPIVFTGAKKERGSWYGLQLMNAGNQQNTLQHAVVEYAGGGPGMDGAVDLAGTGFPVYLKMQHTTVRHNKGWGLDADGNSKLADFIGNLLVSNAKGPVRLDSLAAHQLLPASTYTGNDTDEVRIRANRIGTTQPWQDIGVPYAIDGNMHVDVVWTIDPGVTLKLAKDAWISADGDAAGIHAVGTVAKPIVITGWEKTAGFWKALRFGSTNNAANAFSYATIEYGGSLNAGGEKGMVNLACDSHGATLSVTNSTLRHSGQYAIWACGAAKLSLQGNTFAGNATGDVYQQK